MPKGKTITLLEKNMTKLFITQEEGLSKQVSKIKKSRRFNYTKIGFLYGKKPISQVKSD